MSLKIIKNSEDHAAAMARLSALMSSNPARGSKGENELDLLALVIEDFERRTVSPVQADPVEAILFRMEQMNLARRDLAPYIGSVSKVSEVLSRKRPLSLSMIRRLHQGLGIALDVLVREGSVDSRADSEEGVLSDLEYSRFPLKEMLERGCFGGFDGGVRKLKDRASEMVGEFVRKKLRSRWLRRYCVRRCINAERVGRMRWRFSRGASVSCAKRGTDGRRSRSSPERSVAIAQRYLLHLARTGRLVQLAPHGLRSH